MLSSNDFNSVFAVTFNWLELCSVVNVCFEKVLVCSAG